MLCVTCLCSNRASENISVGTYKYTLLSRIFHEDICDVMFFDSEYNDLYDRINNDTVKYHEYSKEYTNVFSKAYTFILNSEEERIDAKNIFAEKFDGYLNELEVKYDMAKCRMLL